MIAYLDIETSWQGEITVVGIYRPDSGVFQLIAPKVTKKSIRNSLEGVKVIYTYNGSRFDLPVIKNQIGLNLEKNHRHHDLMFDCWKNRLYGGLKIVERKLGICRETEGVDGIMAMNLWRSYRLGDREALNVLLHYNREDVQNLEILAKKLGVYIPENVANPVASVF